MNETVKKTSKKDKLFALKAITQAAETAGMDLDFEDITYDTLYEFIDHEIELLENKAAAAQKRAASKKAEGDALREQIYNVLSDTDYMTTDEIVKALGDEDITAQMVTSRLTQLVSADVAKAEKTQITIAGKDGGRSRKLSAYRKLG